MQRENYWSNSVCQLYVITYNKVTQLCCELFCLEVYSMRENLRKPCPIWYKRAIPVEPKVCSELFFFTHDNINSYWHKSIIIMLLCFLLLLYAFLLLYGLIFNILYFTSHPYVHSAHRWCGKHTFCHVFHLSRQFDNVGPFMKNVTRNVKACAKHKLVLLIYSR